MNRNRARMLRGWGGEGHDTSRRAAAAADSAAPTITSKNQPCVPTMCVCVCVCVCLMRLKLFSLSFISYYSKKASRQLSPPPCVPLYVTIEEKTAMSVQLSGHRTRPLARAFIHFLWLYTEQQCTGRRRREQNWAVLSHYTSLEGIVV